MQHLFFRTFSSSNEIISDRRQANLILKRAICPTCPVHPHTATSSSESLAQRPKCVHLLDHISLSPLRNRCADSTKDARCIITTHKKPLHVYSIIPFRKRASSSASKVKEKLDVRSVTGVRRLRQTSASRPMSSAGENQPFDPFDLLGLERDGGQEVSYGYLLVPSKFPGGKNGVSVITKFLKTFN